MLKIFKKIILILANCLIIFFVFFNSENIFAQKKIAHTIRCKDGAVLLVGEVEAIKKSKEFLTNLESAKTKEIYNFFKEKNIRGIVEISYFLAPKIKTEKVKLSTLTIKEAQKKGLIPFIENQNIIEAEKILQQVGYTVILNPTPIGTTEIFSPVDIYVESAGVYVGNYANIFVERKNVSLNERGFNIVVIDNLTGKVEQVESFDTWLSSDESVKMTNFIKKIPSGKIVLCAVKDEGAKRYTDENFQAIKSLGGKINFKGYRHFSYILIGIKNAPSGNAFEELSSFPLAVYLHKNSNKAETLLSEKLLNEGNIIYLTNTQKNSQVQISTDEIFK